jgi:hypothetical protein
MWKPDGLVAAGLVGLVIGLLAVGVVSGTPVRHVLQVLPAVFVMVAARRRASWAPFAALPIFGLWLLLMVAIWLWLLGLVRVVSGQFTPAEVGLTVLIAVSCVLGTAGAVPCKPRPRLWAGILAFVGAGVAQVAAIWMSLQEPFARR